MGSELLSPLMQLLIGILGALSASAIGVAVFFFNKIEREIKRKSLISEINRYLAYVEQVKSFQLMSAKTKRETIQEKAQQYAMENGIAITEMELALIIEKSIQSLWSLESTGLMKMKKYNLERGGK